MGFARIIFFSRAAVTCRSGESSYTVGEPGPWKEGYGIMSRRGIDLAVEANASSAATIAQELVANPAVLAVIGHVNSGAMLAPMASSKEP